MAGKQRFLITLVVGLAAFSLVFSGPVWAKVEGDTIIFGAAVSFTGKYSTNGKHTKNGYDLAVKRVNEMGGINVAGKNYKIAVKYYDDESTPARAGQLADRLIKQVRSAIGCPALFGSGAITCDYCWYSVRRSHDHSASA